MSLRLVDRYLIERDRADRDLCSESTDGFTLRPELSFYGCPYCHRIEWDPDDSALSSHAVTHRYVRCRFCGLVYPWPRLNRKSLAERVNAPWLNAYLKKTFETFTDNPSYLPFPRGEFQRLAGQRVLEIGPGSGQLLGYLTRLGADVVGIEPNQASFEYCASRGFSVIGAPFDEEIANRSELKGSFDAVVFMESLYHLFDLADGLKTTHRLLRGTGSRLILSSFDVDSFPMRCLAPSSVGVNGLSIPIFGSPSIFSPMLEASGFRVIKVYRCPGNMLGNFGLDIRWVTSPLAAFFLNGLGRATGNFLRFFKQSRNFVLVAEKK